MTLREDSTAGRASGRMDPSLRRCRATQSGYWCRITSSWFGQTGSQARAERRNRAARPAHRPLPRRVGRVPGRISRVAGVRRHAAYRDALGYEGDDPSHRQLSIAALGVIDPGR